MKKVVFNHPAIIDRPEKLRAQLIIAKVKEMSVPDLNILIQLLPDCSLAKHRVQCEIYMKVSSSAIAPIFECESFDAAFSRGTILIPLHDDGFVAEEDEGKLIH